MPATSTTDTGRMDATGFRSEHLDRVMKVRNLSDDGLGRRVGKHRSSIHRYRTGRVAPSLKVAVRIAEELQLPLTDLVEVKAA